MDKEAYLNQMDQAWRQCRACPRLVERKNAVFGYGNPDAEIVIVGEAPGTQEDASGLPFVGRSGHLLDIILGQASIRPEVRQLTMELTSGKRWSQADEKGLRDNLREWLYQDFFFTNCVMCHPPENADPIPKEIASCNTRLMETIYVVDPILVMAVGRISAETLFRAKSINIGKVRGELHEMSFQGRLITFNYPVIPIYHTSYLMRKNDFANEDGDAVKTLHDVIRAMHIYDELKFRHDGTPKPLDRPPLNTRS